MALVDAAYLSAETHRAVAMEEIQQYANPCLGLHRRNKIYCDKWWRSFRRYLKPILPEQEVEWRRDNPNTPRPTKFLIWRTEKLSKLNHAHSHRPRTSFCLG